ncbi:uncharacterized protein LOC129593057 isoform X2 [Paramacrobiotus metropolitanus]|uniref:uncharacterized protein LOC129593057 isoform X2 n=1 Tax=Paramacrobiotus metropolitanus TaxID=2943436 RepID=UPI002446392E|nr:uncharacterized protein LOC129593057 isoform X2 [Paramacrobiotus metropolitanus]XP_055345215.1 uncharacterized protein LOC129593057 isoform X2 [Paramacrobiotus metropolitanus]
MGTSWLWICVSCMFLWKPIVMTKQSSLNDQRYTATATPFPRFSAEPMTRDQCTLQFTENCRPFSLNSYSFLYSINDEFWANHFSINSTVISDQVTPVNCSFNHGLHLNCNNQVNAQEMRQLAASLSQPPLRAVFVNLTDGPLVTLDNLSPVRQQTIILNLYFCASTRTTGKLVTLGFPNLLNFELHNCRAMVVKKTDFWSSIKLRMILFANTTLRSLEENTFTDLPALRLISLEKGFSEMEVFSKDIRNYLQKLHCGCEYEWFRQWWSKNQLLRSVDRSQIFHIPTNSWHNDNVTKRDMYLPIDCAANPFPEGSEFIDFAQDAFSINEKSDAENGCPNEMENTPFPVFSMEPATAAECDYQQQDWRCSPLITPTQRECPEANLTGKRLNPSYCLSELRSQSAALARLPPRPLSLFWLDNITAISTDLGYARSYIVYYESLVCSQHRTTAFMNQLKLTGLLAYQLSYCSELEIRKADFYYSIRLREFRLYNSTIRSLENNAFSGLPSLRLLLLESNMRSGPEIEGHTWTFPKTAKLSLPVAL